MEDKNRYFIRTQNCFLDLDIHKNKIIDQKFFDSLKQDYPNFVSWYQKSTNEKNKRGYYWFDNNELIAFIGLKIESSEETEFLKNSELLKKEKILKITTIKCIQEKIKLFFEFVIFIATHTAIMKDIDKLYFSVILDGNKEKQKLYEIAKEYGFIDIEWALEKNTKFLEHYLVKQINSYNIYKNLKLNYPILDLNHYKKSTIVFLPIKLDFHDNYIQSTNIYDDVYSKSTYNLTKDPFKMSISKVYLHNQKSLLRLKKDDILIFYRYNPDNSTSSESVITGVGIVNKSIDKKNLLSITDLKNLIKNKHAFSSDDILEKKLKEYRYLLEFTHILSFESKNFINLSQLKNINCWISGVHPNNQILSMEQFIKILELAKVNEKYYKK